MPSHKTNSWLIAPVLWLLPSHLFQTLKLSWMLPLVLHLLIFLSRTEVTRSVRWGQVFIAYSFRHSITRWAVWAFQRCVHKISVYVKPGTYMAEIQLPPVSQRLPNLYLVLKTSLVFPFSWDKVVCFLASCLGEVGTDHCGAFYTQSLFDILWLILWEEKKVLKRARDQKWQYCITILLIRLICLRFGSLQLSSVIICSTAGFISEPCRENLFIAPFYSWRIVTGQLRGK